MNNNMKYEDIIKSKHLILTDQGVFEPQYNMLYKGTMDHRLQTHIDKQPLKFKNVASMARLPMHLSRLEVKGNDSQPVTLVSTQLSKLRFNTTFEVIDKSLFEQFSDDHKKLIDVDGLPDKWLSPTFNNERDQDRGQQTYTLDWEVPDYLSLYITMEYIGMTREGTWRPARSYLHCKIDSHSRNEFHEECKGWFILPTGNVYETSEICFGETYLSDIGIIDATKKNIDLFYSTPWNSDLTNNHRNKCTKALFRFEVESNQQISSPCPPHILLESFSRSYLEGLAI